MQAVAAGASEVDDDVSHFVRRCPERAADQAVLQRLVDSQSHARHLREALDIAIAMVHADLGTVQRFNEQDDCLKIVASCGFSDEVLELFRTVRRSNTTCAAALSQRMRVSWRMFPRAISLSAHQSSTYFGLAG
jgi:hypothetical protein